MWVRLRQGNGTRDTAVGKPAGKVAVITVGRIAMGLATAPTFDEIAGPALFLASDDGSFVTGIELTVDGGLAQA